MEGRAGIKRLWCLLQGKVEEMKERTKKLLRANQDLKAVILKRLKPNTDTQNTEQAELQGKKVQLLARSVLGTCLSGSTP